MEDIKKTQGDYTQEEIDIANFHRDRAQRYYDFLKSHPELLKDITDEDIERVFSNKR